MKLVFAGTPEFAKCAYDALLAAGHAIPLVMTQPDRPAGRGMKLQASPVKQAALEHHSEVIQPKGLRLDGKYGDDALAAQARLQAIEPDVIVVAAYGLILPRWLLDLPRFGCLNIHASLLPRWRGAAPIQRAIEAGDALTGITIMQMDEGLDTGSMWLKRELSITHETTSKTLHDQLCVLGGELIVEVLSGIQTRSLSLTAQPEEGVTYAAKLDKGESMLDFTLSAVELERRIRAFDPVPGSTFMLPGFEQAVKVWRAQVLDREQGASPGSILSISPQGIDVATSKGVLRMLELQKSGGKRQPVDVFVRGMGRE